MKFVQNVVVIILIALSTVAHAQEKAWVDIFTLDSTIQLDLRYASTNNFVEEQMYECGRCYFRTEVAQALVKVHQDLQKQGYGGLKMYDCYRPRSVQYALWKKVPNPQYVADPAKGSMHNRGSAADLTVLDKNGKELDMGTAYDFFGPEAHYDYTKHSPEVIKNRQMLRAAMKKQGFNGIRTEWWHFSYTRKSYNLSDFKWKCE